MTEIIRTWQGYQVRILRGGKWFYVSNYYNGKYIFVRDYLYAKPFSMATAKKHLNKLQKGV